MNLKLIGVLAGTSFRTDAFRVADVRTWSPEEPIELRAGGCTDRCSWRWRSNAARTAPPFVVKYAAWTG